MQKTVGVKIKKFLQNNMNYSYNAPTIYKKFKGKIPINTIRSELKRLYENNEINKPDRGFYQAKVDMETIDLIENPPTLLHAITITAKSPKLQKLRQGLTSPNCSFETWMDFLEWLEFDKNFKVSKYSRGDKKQYTRVLWFDDRDVKLTVHSNCSVDIYVGCSRHPLNYFEFRDMYSYVQGFLGPIAPLSEEYVTQLGINKDYQYLDMDGCKSLRLKHWTNAWFQVYRKESIQRTRFECHMIPKPVLSVRDAFNMIESLCDPFKGNNGVDNTGGMFR